MHALALRCPSTHTLRTLAISQLAVSIATDAPDDYQDPVLPPAAVSTPCHAEDFEEELDEEQAGEDEEVAVFGAVFTVLDMSFDVQHSQEE